MMSDYKELIERIRQSAQSRKHFCISRGTSITPHYIRFMFEAADAIEQLVKERDAAVEDLTFSYKHGLSCFACKHDFAVDAAEHCIDCKFNSNFEWRGVQNAQSTVDVVLVVRCRECKHRGTDDCPMHIKGVPADEDFLKMVDNDFCSYGERKDGVSE